MKEKDELRDELENSPFLKKMKERPDPKGASGFQVPQNYFRHLPNEVMRKVKEPVFEPTPQPSWLERIGQLVQGLLQPQYALVLSSVVVLVVAGIIFFNNGNTVENPQPIAALQLSDISDEELFAYVSENINDYDHEQMLEVTGSDVPELKTKPKAPTLPKITTPKPETKEIEEYLDDAIDEIDVEDLEDIL